MNEHCFLQQCPYQFRTQAFNETASFLGSAPAFILTKTSTKERTGAYTMGFNKVVKGGVVDFHLAKQSQKGIDDILARNDRYLSVALQ